MHPTETAEDADDMTAIVIVTYNAAIYTALCLLSLRRTRGLPVSTIVVDNNSGALTRFVLRTMFKFGSIDRLVLLDENTLFSPECNVGAAVVPCDAQHILLLNPDTIVRDPDWLAKPARAHRGAGAVAYGRARGGSVTRADGYCFLVDRATGDAIGGLDESFEWWWAITRFQADVLRSHGSVAAIEGHGHLLRHFGGKSGDAWRSAKGMDTPHESIASWFDGLPAVEVIAASDVE